MSLSPRSQEEILEQFRQLQDKEVDLFYDSSNYYSSSFRLKSPQLTNSLWKVSSQSLSNSIPEISFSHSPRKQFGRSMYLKKIESPRKNQNLLQLHPVSINFSIQTNAYGLRKSKLKRDIEKTQELQRLMIMKYRKKDQAENKVKQAEKTNSPRNRCNSIIKLLRKKNKEGFFI